jgi:trk system potassium uptake protein TrkH
LNPSQLVLISFTAFILIGTFLLSLPVAHQGAAHSWVDDLFMAASAVCVTGLASLDPSTSYSVFGQWILMLLIQVGGLGYMILFTVSMVIVGKQLSMRDRLNLQEATDQPGMAGLIGFAKNIVKLTLVVEGIGFVLLALNTVPELGWQQGLYIALFHAISAFNNAGFSLFSEGAMHWQGHAPVLMIIAGLVIVGGLGYNVNHEVVRRYLLRRKPKARWDVLLKVVLISTAILLSVATLLIWLVEHNNPATLGSLPWYSQWSNAFFMAVQPRTAGFNSLDVGSYERSTLMFTMVLMFVGGGPGGTAGGIKLTTAAVIVAAMYSAIVGHNDVNMLPLKRRVSEKIVRKAFTVMALSIILVVVVTTFLAAIEPLPFLPILFEVTSAFATVGLSMGITGDLSDASKLILAVTMLAGRVGVLAIMLAIFKTRRSVRVRYAEEPLLVG